MTVAELIAILRDFDPDLDVEMAIVCPVDQPDDRVAVDRYPIEVVLPWSDEEEATDLLWFVGGEERDLDAFEEAMGLTDEAEDDGLEGGGDGDGRGDDDAS